MFKTVTLKELKPNPMRDLRVDPLDKDRVVILSESVDTFGFRSGGVVCRQKDGMFEIASGHTRVAGAIKSGIKEATVEVVPLTDAEMVRWYAQENTSQRGQSPTAGPGAIISAVRILAPLIMRGDLDGLKEVMPEKTSHKIVGRCLETLQGQIASAKGLGEDLITDFYDVVEGLKISQIRDYLEIAKATGAYDRTIKEVATVILAEDKEAEAKRKAKAIREEMAEAEAAKKAAKAGKKPAKPKKTTAKPERTPTTVAKGAVGVVTVKTPSLSEGVSALFDNKNQVKVFFKTVKNIGTDVLPVSSHVDLAKKLIKLAKDTPNTELSATFIREQIHYMLFKGKIDSRRQERDDMAEARRRNVKLNMEVALHNLFRDIQRMVLQGVKLRDMIEENPDVPLHVTPGQKNDIRNGKKFLDLLEKAAEKPDNNGKVVPLRPLLTHATKETA